MDSACRKAWKVTTGFEQAWVKEPYSHFVGSCQEAGQCWTLFWWPDPTNRNPLQAKISSRLELVVTLTGSLALSQFSIAKHLGTEVAGRPM